MDVIKFNERDVEILFFFPKEPAELSQIILHYKFFNRTYAPTFDEVTSCFSKLLRAGIITEAGGKYTVNEGWYRKIHIKDEIAENEIEAMLSFQESFVGIEFPVVNGSVSLFSREYYGMALNKISY